MNATGGAVEPEPGVAMAYFDDPVAGGDFGPDSPSAIRALWREWGGNEMEWGIACITTWGDAEGMSMECILKAVSEQQRLSQAQTCYVTMPNGSAYRYSPSGGQASRIPPFSAMCARMGSGLSRTATRAGLLGFRS